MCAVLNIDLEMKNVVVFNNMKYVWNIKSKVGKILNRTVAWFVGLWITVCITLLREHPSTTNPVVVLATLETCHLNLLVYLHFETSQEG